MAYNPNTVEQRHKLKDGRVIFKTHNGFKYYVVDKKSKTLEVSKEYYKKLLKHKL